MKKITLIILAIFFCHVALGQKKEKVKGSKMVTIEQKKVEDFEAIEVHDDLEISLVKGDKNGVELEADDNLQDALLLSYNGNMLIISAAKDVTDYKKFSIRVTYTGSFKKVIAKDKSKVSALEEVVLDEISFQAFDNAKLYLNLNPKAFSVSGNDKSHIEMNAKTESGAIELSKNAELKALISATELKCDLYQKAAANIEGDVIDLKVRMDNNSNFTGKKLTAKNMKLLAEGYSHCSILVETALALEMAANSEVQLFGEPKIDMIRFADSATLYKKPLK